MEIPDFLIGQISEGNVVLLLGSGASKGATNSKGEHPPDGKELGNILSNKFLGGKFNNSSLSQIAEYAISESSLTEVQEFIAELFRPFEPASFHLKICNFLWFGLATTNYDLVIEKAYQKVKKPLQSPVPFIENGDNVDRRLKAQENISFLKLHGCITRTTNEECPFILTIDQYITHKKGRSRLYSRLTEWAYEHPIIFVGHSLEDSDLRAIMLGLDVSLEKRPRYYVVVPKSDDIEIRSFERKRITVLTGTAEEFLDTLETKIKSPFRGLHISTEQSFPITERFIKKGIDLSANCKQFLHNDVDYVKSIISTEAITPSDFYKGFSGKWSAIEQDLDAPRKLTEIILLESFLVEESEHPLGVEHIRITAHAGAGKSVLLHRLAWDAARDYNKLCLFLHANGTVNASAIQELIELCGERIYLFVDNAADHVRELIELSDIIGKRGNNLTVILAERTNEWNVACEALNSLISSSYSLGYLSTKDIELLVALLEKHKSLGTLQNATPDERIEAFSERAGRQLLVALHEATLGKPFEEIVVDEYKNIVPAEAQQIYLTICILNRLDVAVRAGIISRLHGVPFSDFKARLFAPLEHIVHADYNKLIRDYEYSTRHPHIAEIVFERVLVQQDKKYDAYIQCLQALNIDYSADRKAFRGMLKAKTLMDLFSNHELIKTVYEIAKENAGNDPYVLHQLAIYEMKRPQGNLEKAADYLTSATKLAPYDLSIRHSKAELSVYLAERARTPLEKEKYLRDASAIVISIKNASVGNSYAYHTLVKIGLIRLKDSLDKVAGNLEQAVIVEIVKDIENVLFEGLQQFPSDPYLCAAESDLAKLLSDSDRAFKALEKAFESNLRNAFIALRLADCYQKNGDLPKAKATLKKAIDAKPGEKRLHYAYARLLLLFKDTTDEELMHHLRRAFTDGDNNYDAQLLYGRQLFLKGDISYKNIFRDLSGARINPELKIKLRYPIDKIFTGAVVRLESTFCFIARDGANDWIFAYKDNIDEKVWANLKFNIRVSFKIAFTIRGPCATDVNLE